MIATTVAGDRGSFVVADKRMGGRVQEEMGAMEEWRCGDLTIALLNGPSGIASVSPLSLRSQVSLGPVGTRDSVGE